MKHVLPFKEKEIEQRRLEAEAGKVTRLKQAEAEAEARRIEAGGEADSRRKLADAEAYRIDSTGKASAQQMAREAALIQKNPLLIQKTLADKLSDKIQVIIAPPGNKFIAGGILGGSMAERQAGARRRRTRPRRRRMMLPLALSLAIVTQDATPLRAAARADGGAADAALRAAIGSSCAASGRAGCRSTIIGTSGRATCGRRRCARFPSTKRRRASWRR